MKCASIDKMTFRTTHFRKVPQPGAFDPLATKQFTQQDSG